jgi:hypothetical protein
MLLVQTQLLTYLFIYLFSIFIRKKSVNDKDVNHCIICVVFSWRFCWHFPTIDFIYPTFFTPFDKNNCDDLSEGCCCYFLIRNQFQVHTQRRNQVHRNLYKITQSLDIIHQHDKLKHATRARLVVQSLNLALYL